MPFISRARDFLVFASVALSLCACKGAGVGTTAGLPAANLRTRPADQAEATRSKIQHVVIIIQENRSFNNLFYGFPGALTSKYGYISTGQKIALQPVSLATTWDLQHNAETFILSCNGKGKVPGTECRMNGFDRDKWYCGVGSEPRCPSKYPPYSYVPQSEVRPYFDMAHQYVLADQMYSSDYDISSFISHQYIIAAQNPESSVNFPLTDWGCPGGPSDKIYALKENRQIPREATLIPCWDPKTLADELDAARISWAFYAAPMESGITSNSCGGAGNVVKGASGIWSAYQAIRHICYGGDWNDDVISPPSRFFRDLADTGLRSVTWITPTYPNSDHGGSGSKAGPSWVASLVNAIGESKFWDSTAIFIFWDDPGGWYDPEPPAYLDNDGLGYRLPLLIISPYAKAGVVVHEHFEHGSILKFVEDQFGLQRLAASDTRANSPGPYAFDFEQAPRKFVPIKAPLGESYFMHQALDFRAPDND